MVPSLKGDGLVTLYLIDRVEVTPWDFRGQIPKSQVASTLFSGTLALGAPHKNHDFLEAAML